MKRFFYFFYQWFVFLPIFIVSTVLCAVITILGSVLLGDRYWGYYPGRIWAKILCYSSLVKVSVKGREYVQPGTSYIFVANHTSMFDILLVYGFLDHNFKWIMKGGIRYWPFIGAACKAAGHIYVDHSSAKAAVETIHQAEESLRKGLSIVMFPEGSRTYDGKMTRFKRGAFQMAIDLKLPLVPMTINGGYNILKIGKILLTPGPLELVIHPPIDTTELTAKNISEYSKRVYDTIQFSLPDKYRDEPKIEKVNQPTSSLL